MRLLLDTHAFLWFVFDDPRLSTDAANAVANPANARILSIASMWEIVIKKQLGKLELGFPTDTFFERFIYNSDIEVMGIQETHLLHYEQLPMHHRDPFDRLLIAQAQCEEMTFVSGDQNVARYGVAQLW